jgi:hypothetical protein
VKAYSLTLIPAGEDPEDVFLFLLNPAQRQIAPTLALYVSDVGSARAETW